MEAARRQARVSALARGAAGHGAAELELIVSELARNILDHAVGGEVTVMAAERSCGGATLVIAADHGPGIDDVSRAFTAGFSSGGGLGQGLPMVRRLADECEVDSGPWGTRIVVLKCLN